MYELRDEKGTLLSTLSDEIAKVCIMKSHGHFETKHFTDNTSKKCYVFDEDGRFNIPSPYPSSCVFYLWKGSYLRES